MDVKKEKELKAYTFAYLWVAAADGRITRMESSHFLTAITETKAFDLDNTRALNDVFLDTRDYFNAKYPEAAAEAKDRIREYKDTQIAENIIAVARLGVIADASIEDREEVVLSEIAKTLGVANA